MDRCFKRHLSRNVWLALPLVLSLLTGATVLAQPGRLPADASRYVEKRLKEAERELKALQKLIAERRRKGGSARPAGVRVYDEVSVLSWAEGQLQAELQMLNQLDRHRRGKPAYGDPRAEVRAYTIQGLGLNGTTDYYRQQLRDTEAVVRSLRQTNRADDASVLQWAVDAYPALFNAIGQRLTTTDYALAALGSPNVATLADSHRKALEARDEALRMRRARQEYEARQALDAVMQAGAVVAKSFFIALEEQNNFSFDDLGEGGAAARESGSFSPIGLRQGEFLGRIYAGRGGEVPRDIRLRLTLDAWVVKYSGMCEDFLPPIRSEIMEIPVHTVTGKNIYGGIVSQETTYGARKSTGIFATPEFARAFVRVSGADLLRTIEAYAEGPAAAIDTSTAIRVDIRRLIARHGCDSQIAKQFARNLLQLVQ